MINPDSPTTEVLPGFTRADLEYLAQCLEGVHGQGRETEAGPRAAAFIRAAMSPAGARLRPFTPGAARLLARTPTDNDLEREVRSGMVTPLTAQGDGGEVLILSESERRMIEKQRAHEARNASNEEDGNGGLPPV